MQRLIVSALVLGLQACAPPAAPKVWQRPVWQPSEADLLCDKALEQVRTQTEPAGIESLAEGEQSLLRRLATTSTIRRNRVFALGAKELWGTSEVCRGLGPEPSRGENLQNCPDASWTETATKTSTKGVLRKQVIADEFSRWLGHYRACFEQYIDREGELTRSGKIVTRSVIGADGLVESAGISVSQIGDRVMDECIRKITCNLVFPKPRRGGRVYVSYPFEFHSR